MRILLQLFFVFMAIHLIHGKYGFFYAKERMPFDNAVNYCKGRLANLVNIGSIHKNGQLMIFAIHRDIDWYWINVNDKNEEGIWVDGNNNETSYRNWHAVQPNGGRHHNCVLAGIQRGGRWDDWNCTTDWWVICEKPLGLTIVINHVSATKRMNYSAALAFCDAKSMVLVTANSALANTRAHEYAKEKKLGTFWIDGNDIRAESIFVNSRKERLSFQNWHHLEPNGHRNENCIAGGYHSYEAWNDVPCTRLHSVICVPRE